MECAGIMVNQKQGFGATKATRIKSAFIVVCGMARTAFIAYA